MLGTEALLCCSPRERYTLNTLYLFPAGASHADPRGSAPHFAHLPLHTSAPCTSASCCSTLLCCSPRELYTLITPRECFHCFHTAARFTRPTLVLRVAHRAFTCFFPVSVRCPVSGNHSVHSTFVHTVYVTGTLCVLALIRVQGNSASVRRGVYRGSCLAAPGST